MVPPVKRPGRGGPERTSVVHRIAPRQDRSAPVHESQNAGRAERLDAKIDRIYNDFLVGPERTFLSIKPKLNQRRRRAASCPVWVGSAPRAGKTSPRTHETPPMLPQPRGNGTPRLGSERTTPVLNARAKALPKALHKALHILPSRDQYDTPTCGGSETTTADERDATLEAHTASAAQQTVTKKRASKSSKSKKNKRDDQEKNAHMKVFVGGLSQSTTNETLREAFASLKKGVVVEAEVLYDQDSERSRGFGFVEFSPKRMEFRVDLDRWVEVDFDLVEDFWGGSDQPQLKTIRIDGVDCGVYAYRGKKA